MSPKSLGRIALAVFRESVRERVLYNLVGFALLVIGASYLIGQMTAGQDVKIIKDLGLSAMAIFGLFIAIFIGIGLVSKEIERRSIYSLIAKPVRRSELVVGKFLGLALTVAINLAVMTVVWKAEFAQSYIAHARSSGRWSPMRASSPAPSPLKRFSARSIREEVSPRRRTECLP